ncbi:hypothetical protein [Paraburkholderia mimosarum]|uniref:hypothetical protein n=1 Tax=Paraburkholderia mimosarum TaxID=312026 RepID=UPI000482E7E9|nr:hypothetical protein [Paraburkholderia mimosarum]
MQSSLKAFFQSAIDRGDITSYSGLLAMVNAESLDVTRNGWTKDRMRYMGLREPSGKRFRLYFHFDEPVGPTTNEAHMVDQDH